MPTVRYQIRNEYGLASPELYQSADKDDPEAILEGVAMAGLVGVLRQLGDLAEFAAEIFHDLHEEVMATAARGHGMMLRVQQLEAEFPSIEKVLLSKTSHTSFVHNTGIDWRANIQVDQNLITQGDMPRFILDSYEECRGPPQLIMLDKFDIAGAGACLKRYSDPSFFKIASSDKMEPEVQREKKLRKNKKGPRWRNGETLESLLSPHNNYDLQLVNSAEASETIPTRRVKLKQRHLHDPNTGTGKSYMKNLLEVRLSEGLLKISDFHSDMKMNSIDSGDSVTGVHDILINNFTNGSFSHTDSPIKQEDAVLSPNKFDERSIDDEELLEALSKPVGGIESKKEALNEVNNKLVSNPSDYHPYEVTKSPLAVQELDLKELLTDMEYRTDGGPDGYISDDITSEMDTYVDALNTMESELETDSESKAKSDPNLFIVEPQVMESETNAQSELQAHSLECDSVKKSSMSLADLFGRTVSSVSNSDAIVTLSDKWPPQANMSSDNVPAFSEICAVEIHDSASNAICRNEEVMEQKLSEATPSDGANNEMESDIPNLRSETKEMSSSLCVAFPSSTLPHLGGEESFTKSQSMTADQNEMPSGYAESIPEVHDNLPGNLSCTEENLEITSQYIGGVKDLRTTENLDISSDAEMDANDMAGSLPGGRDASKRTDPADYAEELTSENTAGTIDIKDILSQTQEASFLDEAPAGCFDNLMVSSTLETEGPSELGETDESHPLTPTIAVFPPEFISRALHPDCLVPEMENIAPAEDFGYSNVSVGLKDVDQTKGLAELMRTGELNSSPPTLTAFSPEYSEMENGTSAEDFGSSHRSSDPKDVNAFVESHIQSPDGLASEFEHFSDVEESEPYQNIDSGELESAFVKERSVPDEGIIHPFSPVCGKIEGPMPDPDHLNLSFGPGIANVESESGKDPSLPDSEASEFHVQFQESFVARDAFPSQYELDTRNMSSPKNMHAISENTRNDFHYLEDVCEMSTPKEMHTFSESAQYDFHGLLVEDQQLPAPERVALNNICDPTVNEEIKVHSSDEEPFDSITLNNIFDPTVNEETKVHSSDDELFDSIAFPKCSNEATKEDMFSSAHFTLEPAILVEQTPKVHMENEGVVIPSQDGEHLELSIVQLESALLVDECDIPKNTVEFIGKSLDQEKEPDSLAVENNSDINDLVWPSSNVASGSRQLEQEDPLPSDCSIEVPAAFLAFDISAAAISIPPSSGLNLPETTCEQPIEPDAAEPVGPVRSFQFDADETPPPPPLPPLEWRMGKLPLAFPASDGKMDQPLVIPHLFRESSTLGAEYGHDAETNGLEMFHPEASVSSLPTLESEKLLNGSLSSDGKTVQPLRLADLPPIIDDVNTHSEDGKHLYSHDVLQQGIPLASNPFEMVSTADESIFQNCSILHVEDSQTSYSSGLPPDSNGERSRLDKLVPRVDSEGLPCASVTLERDLVQPPLTLSAVPSKVEELHNFNYGAYECDSMQLMNLTVPQAYRESVVPQHDFLYLHGNPYAPYDITFPAIEDEKPNGKLCSIRNRPRDPLIEAVASHDRSTLRKVSEMVRHPTKPKDDERNSLLEQIKNKSFTLKPAAATKPNVKGPPTNLKVAAILEKANAIRQAFVGSDDEDDDGDNWSDS